MYYCTMLTRQVAGPVPRGIDCQLKYQNIFVVKTDLRQCYRKRLRFTALHKLVPQRHTDIVAP